MKTKPYFLMAFLVAMLFPSCDPTIKEDETPQDVIVDIDTITTDSTTKDSITDDIVVADTTSTIDNDENTIIDTVIAPENIKDTLILNFLYGENGPSDSYKNIYVIWIQSGKLMQPLYICEKLIKGGLTGTALPYWKINKYPQLSNNQVDAVTEATMGNTDFSISTVIKDQSQKKITVFFETDRSFDPNDWFSNQPAILYSAEIDLDDSTTEYLLTPKGWTPNEDTENIIDQTPMGQLQPEMKYITHFNQNGTFGSVDTRGATKMVKKISVTLK